MSLAGNNRCKGTFKYADHAAVAAMDVNKGRFITINTDDGFNLADLLGQTAFTTATAGVINME